MNRDFAMFRIKQLQLAFFFGIFYDVSLKGIAVPFSGMPTSEIQNCEMTLLP